MFQIMWLSFISRPLVRLLLQSQELGPSGPYAKQKTYRNHVFTKSVYFYSHSVFVRT